MIFILYGVKQIQGTIHFCILPIETKLVHFMVGNLGIKIHIKQYSFYVDIISKIKLHNYCLHHLIRFVLILVWRRLKKYEFYLS